jgi:hypothetical protein
MMLLLNGCLHPFFDKRKIYFISGIGFFKTTTYICHMTTMRTFFGFYFYYFFLERGRGALLKIVTTKEQQNKLPRKSGGFLFSE